MNNEAMTTEGFRKAVQALLQNQTKSTGAVCLPIRLNSPADVALLQNLLQRLMSSPALAQAAALGLLRLDVQISPSAVLPQAPANASTDAIAASAPEVPAMPAEPTELTGLVTERSVRKLDASIKLVSLAKSAVLTPLGRDTLKARGIHIQKNT